MIPAHDNTSDAIARLFSGELWGKFCDDLKASGDDILRPGIVEPLDAIEGYRMLTRLLRGALAELLEWANARHPSLITTCHENIKIVAENPDNIYLGCKLLFSLLQPALLPALTTAGD